MLTTRNLVTSNNMVVDPWFRTANFCPLSKIKLGCRKQYLFSHYLENGVHSHTVFTFATHSLLTKIRPSNLRSVFYSLFNLSDYEKNRKSFFALTKHVIQFH